MAFMAQALRAQDEILQAAMVRLALKASSSSITTPIPTQMFRLLANRLPFLLAL
jgi:hypothetical protein